MPLQKRKKKSKPASDKSVKQVVTQVVKVNIGDTKPKKKRKRKSGGGVARAAVQAPMLAQVPQQFIYPPQSFPQEAQMAPQRPQEAAQAGVQVPDPFPVSALNRVLGSVPRSTLPVQPEVQRPTLMRPAEKPQLVMPEQPVMIPAKIKPTPRPPPIGEIRNVEVVDDPKPFVAKPKLTGVDRVPIGARDLPESASVPMPMKPTLMRGDQKSTLVAAPNLEIKSAMTPEEAERRIKNAEDSKVRMAAMRARERGDPDAPPKKPKGRRPRLVVKQGPPIIGGAAEASP
jgi:hypothetical protein